MPLTRKESERSDRMDNNYIFHVHTYRCGHASDETDEDYVKRAVELGADSITFTDYAPFPGDPFTNRMNYSQLDEYISSLKFLKDKYDGRIEVHIGLEIEYLPSYWSYYEELRANKDIEIMMLGQHHYEVSKGIYSYMLDEKTAEHIGLVQAMCDGIDTGLFDVVAHPDRAFRRQKTWTAEMDACSNQLIERALKLNVKLEKNYSSMKKRRQYWNEFWSMVPDDVAVIYGCDAHAVNELLLCNERNRACQMV